MDNISTILEEIENNPIQELSTLEEIDNEILPSKITIDLLTRKEIIKEWLDGKQTKEIGYKYNISSRAVQKVIDSNEETRLEIEKKYFAVAAARENFRISETKNNLLSYINDALVSVTQESDTMDAEKKIKFLNNISMIFDKLDNASRLNANKPTSVTEHRDIRVDVAEVMKQFQTPEEKLAFLQNQSNNLKKTYEGELATS